MRVLGIDPGLATTGFGLVEAQADSSAVLLDYGTIRTAPPAPLATRLAELHRGLTDVIAELHPDAVAVEELFFASNAATALMVGHARGVILLAAAQAAVPIFEYKPNEVKQALTGYGRADKRQVQEMIRLALGLADIPRPDDAADGVAVALCHLQFARLRELGA